MDEGGNGPPDCAFTITPAGEAKESVITSRCLVTLHGPEDRARKRARNLAARLAACFT